jgi:hypothetical protein
MIHASGIGIQLECRGMPQTCLKTHPAYVLQFLFPYTSDGAKIPLNSILEQKSTPPYMVTMRSLYGPHLNLYLRLLLVI